MMTAAGAPATVAELLLLELVAARKDVAWARSALKHLAEHQVVIDRLVEKLTAR